MEQLSLFQFCYRIREREDGTWVVHIWYPPPSMGTSVWSQEFDSYDDLPTILKEKVAALNLCGTYDDIPGVGRKHESVPPVYWVYTDEACFEGEPHEYT